MIILTYYYILYTIHISVTKNSPYRMSGIAHNTYDINHIFHCTLFILYVILKIFSTYQFMYNVVQRDVKLI